MFPEECYSCTMSGLVDEPCGLVVLVQVTGIVTWYGRSLVEDERSIDEEECSRRSAKEVAGDCGLGKAS